MTEFSRKLKQWTNHCAEYACMVSEQRRGYQSGVAINNHTKAQHGGKIDPNCPACKEIAQKQNEA